MVTYHKLPVNLLKTINLNFLSSAIQNLMRSQIILVLRKIICTMGERKFFVACVFSVFVKKFLFSALVHNIWMRVTLFTWDCENAWPVALLAVPSTAGLRISALCLWWGWDWCPVFIAVKLCLLTLCRLPTAGGEVAGLLGLLGAVLELLEVLELLGVFGVVVVELPPEDTVDPVSDTGRTTAWKNNPSS